MRTATIRVSLTTSLLVLVLLLSAAILAVNVVAGRHIAEDLSSRYLAETELRIEERLNGFFAPVSAGLENARAWANAGVMRPQDVSSSSAVYLAILRSHPQVTSIATGDAAGYSYRIGAEGDDYLVRITEAGKAGVPARYEVLAPDGEVRRRYEEATKFDPRTRPWYVGAREELDRAGSAAAARVVWSEPFVLNTSQHPGIAASLPFEGPGGDVYMTTFNVMLTKLSDFTSSLRPTESGMALVLTGKGEAIGFPALAGYPTPESRVALVKSLDNRMPTLKELGSSALLAASAHWEEARIAGARTSFRDEVDGEPWRTSFRPYDLAPGMRLWIGVAIPESDFLLQVAAQRRNILLVSGGALLLAVALAFGLARAYARPLRVLVEDSDRITTLDLTPAPPIRTHLLEAHRLADAQQRMRAALDSFARYVPTQVVRELLRQGDAARLGGATRPLTVMFSDVREFTAIGEAMAPDAFSAHLSKYFEHMLDLIGRGGGAVDKMIGDAIMSLWGAPVAQADHATRAVRAALASRDWLREFEVRCRATGRPPLRTVFGIATGEAFVGNVGAPTRLSYTALGDVVNLASRLEGATRTYGVGILCDEGVRGATGDAFHWRCVDLVAVKGRQRPARVYEPLGPTGAVAEEDLAFARRYGEAFEAHLARRFAEAEALLASLAPARREDPSVRRLWDLCRAYEASPPPEDWDGVVRRTVK